MGLAFDYSKLTADQKRDLLRMVSDQSLIPPDKMEAIHIVLGDDVFYILFLLAGEEVRFPPQRDLKRLYSGVVSREGSAEHG